MILKNFEDWFALRPHHSSDAECIAGRLIFDVENGIYLDIIRFLGDAEEHGNSFVSGQTMTGWLDYQRPATIVQAWAQNIDGFSIGIDTPAMRDSQRFSANAVIKNVFLEDITEPIFHGIIVEHPALHAWLNPQFIDKKLLYPKEADLAHLSVCVQPPQERIITLSDGTEATIISATRVSHGNATTLERYSVINIRLPNPANYDAISRLAWRISSLFEFLIGARVRSPVYQLPTTHKRIWNGEEREIVAELWYRPALSKNRYDTPPPTQSRFSLENRSTTSLEELLNRALGGSDELIYLADLVQRIEDRDLQITQGYGELLGCLEAFDERAFGSGADSNFGRNIKSLGNLIEKHGTEDDKNFFLRIKNAAPNKFSLLKRLERLHEAWHGDGFRGAPKLSRIRDLRNIIPHGRGLKVSAETAREMAIFLQYLTALGRYHVLKALGFTGDEIAKYFLSKPHRYGMFVPERMFSKPSLSNNDEAHA